MKYDYQKLDFARRKAIRSLRLELEKKQNELRALEKLYYGAVEEVTLIMGVKFLKDIIINKIKRIWQKKNI